jgi:hypothetical protein
MLGQSHPLDTGTHKAPVVTGWSSVADPGCFIPDPDP